MPLTKTIVSLNGKGGVGKSALMTNLAGMASMPGHGSRRCAMIDADPQCTVVDWGHNRAAFIDRNPQRRIRKVDVFAPAEIEPGMIDLAEVKRIHRNCVVAGYDWCFIDTKGLRDVQSNEIAVLADMIIVPCGPDEPDWAKLPSVAPIIDDADTQRGRAVPAFVVLNKMHTSSGPDSVARLASIVSASGIETAPGWLCQRKVVGEAYSAGLSVEELGTDPAGTGEWCRLLDLVATILEASPVAADEIKVA